MDLRASKKYTKALVESIGIKQAPMALEILEKLSKCFGVVEFVDAINSPVLSKQKKEKLILSMLESDDKKIINFIKLLNQKGRLNIIPLICDEIRKHIGYHNNNYELVIYSSFKLLKKEIESIKSELSKKMGVSLYAVEKPMSAEGIRLFVDGVSVETAFLKDSFSQNLREHILKSF